MRISCSNNNSKNSKEHFKMWKILIIGLVILFCGMVTCQEVTVQVNEGWLSGERAVTENDIEYYAFRGIPYAKPPVGDLRFKAPEAPEPWEGMRNATNFGFICFQDESTTPNRDSLNEDCLYLDISTPELPGANVTNKPVIVFIHGGAFVSGTSQLYGGDYLLEKGVVYVGIQYRLGIFGFLSLDIKEVQGNMGLKDQVQALRWIKENIANFGGDPDNVTILGRSAGAASVEYLIISPMARGLFHKAIAQSGSSLNHWAINGQNDLIIEIIKQNTNSTFNNNEEFYNALMVMSAEDVLQLSAPFLNFSSERPTEFRGGLFIGLVPVVEKSFEGSEAFLTEETYSLLKRGEFARIPYLSGVNDREGLMMYSYLENEVEKLLSEQNYADYLPFNLSDSQRSSLNEEFKEVYLENPEYDDSPAIDFFTDVDFIAGCTIASRLISTYNPATFYYEFVYEGTKEPDAHPGVSHGDDVTYVLLINARPQNFSTADLLMKERMVQMWTNFAKFGNPTPEITDILPVIWEPTDNIDRKYLLLDEELSLEADLVPNRVALYEDLYENHWMTSNGYRTTINQIG